MGWSGDRGKRDCVGDSHVLCRGDPASVAAVVVWRGPKLVALNVVGGGGHDFCWFVFCVQSLFSLVGPAERNCSCEDQRAPWLS